MVIDYGDFEVCVWKCWNIGFIDESVYLSGLNIFGCNWRGLWEIFMYNYFVFFWIFICVIDFVCY